VHFRPEIAFHQIVLCRNQIVFPQKNFVLLQNNVVLSSISGGGGRTPPFQPPIRVHLSPNLRCPGIKNNMALFHGSGHLLADAGNG
jgi:hypothetical protein